MLAYDKAEYYMYENFKVLRVNPIFGWLSTHVCCPTCLQMEIV